MHNLQEKVFTFGFLTYTPMTQVNI